jgi:hypothetical protein
MSNVAGVAAVPAIASISVLADVPVFLFPFLQDLVITQIITAEEFWSNHAAEYVKQKQAIAQEVGVSGKWTTVEKHCADVKSCPVPPSRPCPFFPVPFSPGPAVSFSLLFCIFFLLYCK